MGEEVTRSVATDVACELGSYFREVEEGDGTTKLALGIYKGTIAISPK